MPRRSKPNEPPEGEGDEPAPKSSVRKPPARRRKAPVNSEEVDEETVGPESALPVTPYPTYEPEPAPPGPNRHATAFALTYCNFALPACLSVAVILLSYFLFGMFELLTFIVGFAFCCWSFKWSAARIGVVLAVSTWPQARAVARFWTKELVRIPLAVCVMFGIVVVVFGVFWAYLASGAIGLFLCIAADEANFSPPPASDLERGPRPGGIDAKLRDEYERAARNQAERR